MPQSGPPRRDESCPHPCTSPTHFSGRSAELGGRGKGDTTAQQLAGVAPAPRTCPGAPGQNSLPQPTPVLAVRTLAAPASAAAAARTSSPGQCLLQWRTMMTQPARGIDAGHRRASAGGGARPAGLGERAWILG